MIPTMYRTNAVLFLCLLLLAPLEARSRGGYSAHTRHSSQTHTRSSVTPHSGHTYCYSCDRDSRGRIKRSSSAKSEFKRSNPCPSTGRASGGCPGYVIDHKQALKRGGHDHPHNMQWQTKEEAKRKDRVE